MGAVCQRRLSLHESLEARSVDLVALQADPDADGGQPVAIHHLTGRAAEDDRRCHFPGDGFKVFPVLHAHKE